MDREKDAFTALISLRAALEPVVKGKTNPHFGSRYADINDMLTALAEPLTNHGFALTQPLMTLESGKCRVLTRLVHAPTGDCFESYLDFELDNNPQHAGSAITYYRRYTLQSLLAMRAEDDDGQAAAQSTPVTGNMRNAPVRSPADAGPWREVRIHFGNDEGKLIEELSDSSLKWFTTNWLPKTVAGTGQYPPSAKDKQLAAAFQQRALELSPKDDKEIPF